MDSTSAVRLVLQCEFAIVHRDNPRESMIKTSVPKQCTVFTLYSEQSGLAALAHIDDYTDVIHTVNTIGEILKNKYNIFIQRAGFRATVLGSTDDPCSTSQQQAVLRALTALKITFEVIPLSEDVSKRPQIALNTRNGDLIFLQDGTFSPRLQYLQCREYAEWNNILDSRYEDLPGSEIPYFEIKESTRLESDIPPFALNPFTNALPVAEEIAIGLPLQAERTPAQNFDQLLAKLERLLPRERKERERLQKPIEDRDFNLLARKLSAAPSQIIPLTFLLRQRLIFNIDLSLRGAQSGTPLDIATKFENQKAIDLINMYL